MSQQGDQGPDTARRVRRHGSAAAHSIGAEACCELGRGSLQAGDLQDALWHLRHAVEIDGDCISAWQLLGRCFAEMGEELRARRCLTIANRLFLKPVSEGRNPIVQPPGGRLDS